MSSIYSPNYTHAIFEENINQYHVQFPSLHNYMQYYITFILSRVSEKYSYIIR